MVSISCANKYSAWLKLLSIDLNKIIYLYTFLNLQKLNRDQTKNRIVIIFDIPIRGITSGQTATIYIASGKVCLGGGSIWDNGPSYHAQGKVLPLVLHPAGHNDLSVEAK